MTSSVAHFPASKFRAGQDVLLLDLVDRGSAGDDLSLELVFEEAEFGGEAGTVVKVLPRGPGLSRNDVIHIARLVGVRPDDFGERDVIIRDIS